MAIVRWGYVGIACVGAIRVAVACGGSESDANPSLEDASVDGAATNADGAVGTTPAADADVVLPSYCSGIVLYASFDSSIAANVGGGEPWAFGTAKQVPAAHFGGGLELIGDASVDGGAALYFVRPDGGAPVYPEAEGSIAMWMRGNIADGQPVFYRPVATLPPQPLVTAGLALLTQGGRFGLFNTPTNAPAEFIHAFPLAQIRPYFEPNGFNHIVTSWKRGNVEGPTAYLTINGGSGKNFTADPDAGAANPYADAGPTDAGNLRVPYRGYSSTKWESVDASVQALRLGAPTFVNEPGATVDDVAVWDRVLSFEEIADAYAAGVSIREACRLP